MAVVQISRIQHRRGKSEDLPQLASAEIGWSINNRKLYIGNGSTDEGAPALGNTEILTEHSNILSSSNTYTYKGERSGYTVQTASTGDNTRTLQRKLDDFVNVIDFGAKGDGSTDDTTAINRALAQLYTIQDTDPLARRVLYFPAGTFVLKTDSVKLPPYATVRGEGIDKTIIKNETENKKVLVTADSDMNTGPSIGSGTAVTPKHILVQGMTLHQTKDEDVCSVDQASNIRFIDVRFRGQFVAKPTTALNNKACVTFSQTVANETNHIIFEECNFEFQNTAIRNDISSKNIIFDACHFNNLFKGLVVGENIGSGNAVGFRVQHSYFDKIAQRGLHVYAGQGVTSSFNTFRDVANNHAGAGNPTTPVVEFATDGNGCFGDWFERNDTDALIKPRVEHNGKEVYASLADHSINYGFHKQFCGKKLEILDNQSSLTDIGLEFDRTTDTNLRIDYTIVRGIRIRTGTLLIANTTAGSTIEDEFVEDSDVGVTFGLDRSTGVTKLQYLTNNLSTSGNLYYRIERNY